MATTEVERQHAALKKAQDRLIHMTHICDMENEFEMYTIGVLGYMLEAMDPSLTALGLK